MDPVSITDRFVRVLRQRLEERARTKGAAKGGKVSNIRPRSLESVRTLAGEMARAGVDDDNLRRSLIEQLLADQFDPNLVNDAKFQQIVDEVTQVMAADATIGPLLTATLERNLMVKK